MNLLLDWFEKDLIIFINLSVSINLLHSWYCVFIIYFFLDFVSIVTKASKFEQEYHIPN